MPQLERHVTALKYSPVWGMLMMFDEGDSGLAPQQVCWGGLEARWDAEAAECVTWNSQQPGDWMPQSA